MYRKLPTYLPYLGIFVVILVFNWEAIFGLQGLLEDDQYYYTFDSMKEMLRFDFKRNAIMWQFTHFFLYIGKIANIELARLLVVLLFVIPSSSLLYFIIFKFLSRSAIVAFPTAVLPFILPNNLDLPAYVCGSYLYMALLFSLLSLYFIVRYFTNGRFYSVFYLMFVLSYLIATETSELSAVLFPFYLLIIWIYGKQTTSRRVALSVPLLLIALSKFVRIILNPWGNVNNVKNPFDLEKIIYRAINSLDHMNPLMIRQHDNWIHVFLLIIVVTGFLFAISELNDRKIRLNRIIRSKTIAPYLLSLIWFVVSITPFILIARDYKPRYFLFASIGVSILFCTASVDIVKGLKFLNQKIMTYLFIILIVGMGSVRHYFYKQAIIPINTHFAAVKQLIDNEDFPPNSQVVLVSHIPTTLGTGITDKAKGCYQFVSGRDDLTGQIMKEYRFYDPFLMKKNVWQNRWSGINLKEPVFLYRIYSFNNNKYKRHSFALQWLEDEDGLKEWIIWKFHKSGKNSPFVKGHTETEYRMALDSLEKKGFNIDKVLFGGKLPRNGY